VVPRCTVDDFAVLGPFPFSLLVVQILASTEKLAFVELTIGQNVRFFCFATKPICRYQTPLHTAAERGSATFLRILLEAGASACKTLLDTK
jgi:hypothetical protein